MIEKYNFNNVTNKCEDSNFYKYDYFSLKLFASDADPLLAYIVDLSMISKINNIYQSKSGHGFSEIEIGNLL